MSRYYLYRCILAAGAALISLPTLAAEGAYGNYIPGTYGDFALALKPAEGLSIRNDIYYYNADTERAVSSGRIESDLELTMKVNFFTAMYLTDIELLGGSYGFGMVVPLVKYDIEVGLSGPLGSVKRDGSASGLGDLVVAPLIWYRSDGLWNTMLAQYVITPTGDYDKNNLINRGLNYWSFDNNLAVNYLNPTSGQDYSINFGYIYNTENDDTDYQSGQEIHIDLLLNQFLSETFAVGIHAFHLHQITDDTGDGALLGGYKARVSGVGPALMWSWTSGESQLAIVAKWLYEFDAENRMEGNHAFISIMGSF